MRRCHPTRLSEPAGSERRRHPNRHRRVLTRQTLGDERPEPTPMLLPRYRRPPPETSTFPAKLDPSTADPPSHHPSTPLLWRPCESAQWALASDLVSRLQTMMPVSRHQTNVGSVNQGIVTTPATMLPTLTQKKIRNTVSKNDS